MRLSFLREEDFSVEQRVAQLFSSCEQSASFYSRKNKLSKQEDPQRRVRTKLVPQRQQKNSSEILWFSRGSNHGRAPLGDDVSRGVGALRGFRSEIS